MLASWTSRIPIRSRSRTALRYCPGVTFASAGTELGIGLSGLSVPELTLAGLFSLLNTGGESNSDLALQQPKAASAAAPPRPASPTDRAGLRVSVWSSIRSESVLKRTAPESSISALNVGAQMHEESGTTAGAIWQAQSPK